MLQRRSFALPALVCTALFLPVALTGQAKPIEHQIAEAVTPLPEAQRDGATVYGFRDDADLAVVIREGTNDFLCLADTPGMRSSRSRAITSPSTPSWQWVAGSAPRG